MLNGWDGRKQPLMGFNLRQSCYPTYKRCLHSEMGSFMTTFALPASGGSKCFNNPNFVNENNPSLLRHQDYYNNVTTNDRAELVKKSVVPNDPPTQKREMTKRKRKRKRKNKKKNKQTADLKNTESPPMPELTKSFKCISVGPSQMERCRTRVPSVCESEDSFIVFDYGDDETDGVDESTEVSETEGLSSDSCIPHKKVGNIFVALSM